MRWSLLLVAGLLLLAAPPAAADDWIAAADVTERGRKVARILDMVLVPPRAARGTKRTLVLLLDVTDSLLRSSFPGELEKALARNADALAGTRIGVARVGMPGPSRLAPTEDREELLRAVRAVCARPDTSFQNVYVDVRRVLAELRRSKGVRELVLVTLENGDAEAEVDKAAADLRRAHVRCSVIAREAFLSDTLWLLKPPRGPHDIHFTGHDNAFVDLPWGWRFQWEAPNNAVQSGFAMWGLTRLAAATGGRVYLYYPPTGVGHVCTHHLNMICLFCNGDHDPPGDVYQSQRLRAISPPAASRAEILERAAKDPCYVAVQRAWAEAARHNLVYSRPSLRRGPGGMKLERQPYGGWTPLGNTVSFNNEGAHAKKLVRACDEILDELVEAMERADGGLERYRAIAEATAMILRITRFNLLQYVAFCSDVGPKQITRDPSDVRPPEYDVYGHHPKFLGIGYTSLSLCHGVAPFRWVRLPGGEDGARELMALRRHWDAFEKRWAYTPWMRYLRACTIARFWVWWRPGYTPQGRRRSRDEEEDEVVTLPERPEREERPGAGRDPGTAGPVTGGD